MSSNPLVDSKVDGYVVLDFNFAISGGTVYMDQGCFGSFG